jgi:hypothetical protein
MQVAQTNTSKRCQGNPLNIFDAGEWLISKNIHVFPQNRNKEPTAKAWSDRDFTVDEIRKYGAMGIVTCPGRWPFQVIVFDFDGPDERQSWANSIFDICELLETQNVTTGRIDDGEQFYFRVSDDLYVKSNSKVFATGIDLRGTRGQAVLSQLKPKIRDH